MTTVIYILGFCGGISLGAILSMNDDKNFSHLPIWGTYLVLSIVIFGVYFLTNE